jgi:uncharacterized protein YeaO (DUF488 family)
LQQRDSNYNYLASLSGFFLVAVAIKRVYEKPSVSDGKRVLVDRLWPRGLRKPEARVDHWLKDLAPSDSLRKWFGHRPEYFPSFRKRYLHELSKAEASNALEQLYRVAASARQVTLLYGAKDEQHNNAVVLKELLEGMRKPPTSSGPARAAAMRARAKMPRR